MDQLATAPSAENAFANFIRHQRVGADLREELEHLFKSLADWNLRGLFARDIHRYRLVPVEVDSGVVTRSRHEQLPVVLLLLPVGNCA